MQKLLKDWRFYAAAFLVGVCICAREANLGIVAIIILSWFIPHFTKTSNRLPGFLERILWSSILLFIFILAGFILWAQLHGTPVDLFSAGITIAGSSLVMLVIGVIAVRKKLSAAQYAALNGRRF